MKTRTGKIAQLPKLIRDDLNQRLQNGKQGPELLKWLNSLPETQDLVAAKFDHQPINRQNLSEWRHGGYEDWLQHQDREILIQRIAEEGSDLQDSEGPGDLFENASRIAIAELMADLDELHELKGEPRWNRLRTLTRELSRMQNAYTRSRREDLVWTKWTERFLGPNDYKEKEKDEEEEKDKTYEKQPSNIKPPNPSKTEDHHPIASEDRHPRSAECHSAVSPTGSRQSVTASKPPEHPTPQNPLDLPEFKRIQSNSFGVLGAPASRPAQPPPGPVRRDPVALPVPAPSQAEPNGSHIRPIRPISPIPKPNTQTAIAPFDPRAEFLRQAARLKSLREGNNERSPVHNIHHFPLDVPPRLRQL